MHQAKKIIPLVFFLNYNKKYLLILYFQMNLVVNKIRILWLLLNLFGFLQSQPQEYYWIPYELETAQTKSSPGYAVLPENSAKSSQYSVNPSRNFYNNYKYEFVPNSGQYNQRPNNYNYNNYRPRKTELDKDSYYNYYANDKSYDSRKSWEKQENAPQLYFRELDDLKVQPRKSVNNTLAKKPAAVIKRTANEKIPSRKLSKEEIKRVARQTQKQRPGFFWTLFRVAFEVCFIIHLTNSISYLHFVYFVNIFFTHFSIWVLNFCVQFFFLFDYIIIYQRR